jgi:Domain of unknown function (DUF4192)
MTDEAFSRLAAPAEQAVVTAASLMPAEDPLVTVPSPTVRVTTRQQLLSLVPVLLGFHPRASVVILGLAPPGRTLEITLRFPGYDPRNPAGTTLAVLYAVALLARRHCSHAAAVGYGPDEQVAPFLALLREQAASRGIQLTEQLRAEHGRYWSYSCTGPACCPPDGKPYDDTPGPALAAHLPAGLPGVLPSREALAGLIAPCAGEEAALTRWATLRAGQRATRLTERARQSADPVARRHPLAGAGTTAVRAALRACRQDQPVTPAQAGWLLVALHDPWVRDDAVCRTDAAHRRADLKLWTSLTRQAGPGHVAAPATLLAFTAWQAGNAILASMALDRALHDDPRYPLARALTPVILTPPGEAPPLLTPRQVAACYRAAAHAGHPRPQQRPTAALTLTP